MLRAGDVTGRRASRCRCVVAGMSLSITVSVVIRKVFASICALRDEWRASLLVCCVGRVEVRRDQEHIAVTMQSGKIDIIRYGITYYGQPVCICDIKV